MSHPGRVALLVTLMACWASVTPIEARVRSISLAQLARGSDFVVLARVQEIQTSNGLRVARAVPQVALKGGEEAGVFYFVADRTWTCDTSTAVKGETDLLFLCRAPGEIIERELLHQPTVRVPLKPLYLIGHSGRGRMPLRVVDGVTYVLVATRDLLLANGVRTFPQPNSALSPGRMVLLSDIRQALARELLPKD